MSAELLVSYISLYCTVCRDAQSAAPTGRDYITGSLCASMCTYVFREGGKGVGVGAMATGSKHKHNSLFLVLHECFQASNEIP